jgi:hypothetical protein
MSDSVTVLIEVGSKAGLPSEKDLDEKRIENGVGALIQAALPCEELTDKLGLPPDLRVEYRVVARKMEGAKSSLPLRLSIVCPTEIQKVLSATFESEVGDALFQELDGTQLPADLKEELGLNGEACSFEITVSDSAPEELSSEDLQEMAGFAPGSRYSWSKGCNSWPW